MQQWEVTNESRAFILKCFYALNRLNLRQITDLITLKGFTIAEGICKLNRAVGILAEQSS